MHRSIQRRSVKVCEATLLAYKVEAEATLQANVQYIFEAFVVDIIVDFIVDLSFIFCHHKYDYSEGEFLNYIIEIKQTEFMKTRTGRWP